MIDLNDKKTADLIEYFNISVEKAVYYEVFAAPKPGLVDSLSSGAHSDMNILKFVKSADVIIPFFTYLFKEGLTYQEELKNMLLKYRAEGLKTEEKMFSVTKGINTHKGLIFLMGLISFAAGYAYTQKKYINAQTISDIIIKITKDFISNEIENILKKDHDHSHGEEVYLKYGAGGARQEAV